MMYNDISYIDKLDQLQAMYHMSAGLAEAIGVSRRSLPNWRDRPESIKPEFRFNIDVVKRRRYPLDGDSRVVCLYSIIGNN